MRFLALMAFAGTMALSGPCTAQATDPATVEAAKAVVVKMQGDRASTLASMSAPMTTLVQQMGVKDPAQAQTIVQDAVIPVMTAHFDELLDAQARAYASVLSGQELKAIAAFYDTPAGQSLAKAQPRLAQAQLTSVNQWMAGILPEMQAKLMQAMQAKGAAAPKR